MLLGASEAFISKDPFSGKKYHFEFAVWPMMLGFFCEYKKNWFTMIPARFTNWALWLALSVCLVPMLLGLNAKLLVIAGGTFLLLPCLLMYVGGKSLDHRSGKVLHWLGVRTYSIYLWQQPFTICFFLPVFWWPVGALASIGIGALWFRWFELPFLSVARQGAGGRR
jgi:peptidoglycan/LPS O-acetylase OafA/YrhL